MQIQGIFGHSEAFDIVRSDQGARRKRHILAKLSDKSVA
jgi:hypothetical protein